MLVVLGGAGGAWWCWWCLVVLLVLGGAGGGGGGGRWWQLGSTVYRASPMRVKCSQDAKNFKHFWASSVGPYEKG